MTFQLLSRWVALAFLVLIVHLWPGTSKAETEGCIAVFGFELVDLSLDGQINGTKPEQEARLQQMTKHLHDWVNTGTYRKACNMDAVRVEAAQANLSACGCVSRLAKSVGADLAIVSSVHKLSNLILNIRVNVFETKNGTLLAQLNADIRSNTDSSWARGLKWLIDHRLDAAVAALEGRVK